MNKYTSRLTSSQRGEAFNPLSWLFLASTFAYGLGFAFVLPFTDALGNSSAFTAMNGVNETFPIIWGWLAIINIILGATFLAFNIPPFGKVSGLVGFALWVFVGFCYYLAGDYLVLVSVAGPNVGFWTWQYFSLTDFRRQDLEDKNTMQAYDDGRYDANRAGRWERNRNRGVDVQSNGSYDEPDNGTDLSRPVDTNE